VILKKKIFAPLKKAYTPSSDDNNNNEDEWKVMREEALAIFFREEVYKQFENEIKKELEKKAEEYVIEECGNSFMDLLMSGPYRKRIVDSNDDEKFKDNYNSRSELVYGKEILEKVSKMKILIIGMRGLGVETAKNIILNNPLEIDIFDPKKSDYK